MQLYPLMYIEGVNHVLYKKHDEIAPSPQTKQVVLFIKQYSEKEPSLVDKQASSKSYIGQICNNKPKLIKPRCLDFYQFVGKSYG